MSLEPRPEGAVRHQLVVGDRAARFVERVEEWRRVPLGEDQMVVGGLVWVGEVVAQVPGPEDGDQIRRRHARRRVARPGLRAGPDAVDAHLLGHLAGEIQPGEDALLDSCDRHAPMPPQSLACPLSMMRPAGRCSPRSDRLKEWRAQRDSNPRKTWFRRPVLYPD